MGIERAQRASEVSAVGASDDGGGVGPMSAGDDRRRGAKTTAVYAALYKTEDVVEGRRAAAEGRPPKYGGK